jgi:hypothetical protein
MGARVVMVDAKSRAGDVIELQKQRVVQPHDSIASQTPVISK